MTPTTVAIIVATISAVVALASAVGVELLRRKGSADLERIRGKLNADLERVRGKLNADLEHVRHDLTVEREAGSRDAQLAELVRAYQNPVLRSAYDLQSRIYNIHQGFRGRRRGELEYFTSNTAYVIAEFFGWMEIVRREMQFLDMGVDRETAGLKAALDRVQDTFAETSRRYTDHFYIYRGQQRAIGELMIVELNDPLRSGLRSTCMGYATFVEAWTEPPLATWLSRIDARIVDLTSADLVRLVEVQHALIDLIDLADPGHVRFPVNRDKIATPN